MTEYILIGTEEQTLKLYDIKAREVVKAFSETIDPQETYLIHIAQNNKYLFVATT
jgi:hypothetical protein